MGFQIGQKSGLGFATYLETLSHEIPQEFLLLCLKMLNFFKFFMNKNIDYYIPAFYGWSSQLAGG